MIIKDIPLGAAIGRVATCLTKTRNVLEKQTFSGCRFAVNHTTGELL